MRNCRKKVLNGTTQYAALYKQQINPIYWISNFVIRYLPRNYYDQPMPNWELASNVGRDSSG